MAVPQKPTQTLDGIKTDGVTPSTSSRPLIVTNRPMMASDPMLSAGSESETEKPSGEVSHTAPLVQDVMGQTARTIQPTNSDLASEQAAESRVEEEASPKPQNDDNSNDQKPIPDETSFQAEESHAPENTASNEAVSVEGSASNEDTPQKSDTVKLSLENTQASDRDLELEQLIAKGTYAIPIGQVKRRRMKVLFLVLLVILAVIVILDVLLDLGSLSLQGVPHTDFL